jgi:hypothetical protein
MLEGNYLYFGGGYHLYRLDLSSRSIETIFTPDRILVEQPIVADGVAYFGGSSYVDQKMNYGEESGLLAVNLQTRQVQWKFPLGVGGYGTYGTFPVLAGDNIIVCARQHLHSLERKPEKRYGNWIIGLEEQVMLPISRMFIENMCISKSTRNILLRALRLTGIGQRSPLIAVSA